MGKWESRKEADQIFQQRDRELGNVLESHKQGLYSHLWIYSIVFMIVDVLIAVTGIPTGIIYDRRKDSFSAV